MLTRFTNEVLAYGPTAVLPQNLNPHWLATLQKISDDFLDSNFTLDECRSPQDIGDPILVACVYEIVQYQRGGTVRIEPAELAEKATVYALCVMMESVQRESDIGLESPSLENIFAVERFVDYKKKNPEFIHILEKACIIRNTGKNEKRWFQNIKNKLFSSVLSG